MSEPESAANLRQAQPLTDTLGVRKRVLIGAGVLGALTVSICAYTLWRSWDAAIQRADAEARNLAILIDRNVSTVLDKSAVALGTTAAQLEREIASQGIDRQALWTLVDSATSLVPEIAQIGVFDARGQQVCGEPAPRCLNLDVADRDYFQQLRDGPHGKTRLSGPYTSRVDGQPSLVLARALRDGGGSFAGVVIALIPLARFERLLGAVDLGPEGALALRRTDLGLLLRLPRLPAGSPAEGGSPVSEAFARAVRAMPDEGGFRGSNPLDGIERQTRYRRLSDFPIYAVVGLGTWEFLAPWRVQAYLTLGFLALFLASAALIARLLLRASRDQQRILELYDHAPCGYHSLDADGLYRHINATELRWLGCKREEVIGKLGPKDFFTPEGRAVFQRSFASYRGTGHVEGLEFELQGRDGSVRQVVVSATAVRDAGGNFLFSSSVMYDITELHHTRQELGRFVEQLEQRVRLRTQEIRLLAAELDAAESRERQQLARDLHDDLGQILAAARMHLAALESHPDPAVQAVMVRIADLIDRANRSTRSLAAQLVPPMLFELGLTAALEWLGDELEGSFGLRVSVVDDGQPKPLTRDARSILYRATRELLINAAKHAGADTAEVEIERRGDEIVVRVADSGAGFDARQLTASKGQGQGMGLLSVRERLAFIGGSIEIRSLPGDGAVITLAAPLAPAQELTQA